MDAAGAVPTNPIPLQAPPAPFPTPYFPRNIP